MSTADFDDNFGDDFGATAQAVPTSTAEPSAQGAAAGSSVGGDHHASELAAAGGLGAGAGVLGAGAVHAAEPSHDAAASQQLTSETDASGPFGGEGVTADKNRPDEPDADEDEDSSDDDDEGPEEVGGYKARGYDTPVGGAADRFPEVDAAHNDASALTAAAPEQDGERTVPGGLEDVTTASAPTASAAVDPTAIGDIGERTASTTSIAPVSRQDTISSDVNESSTVAPAQTKESDNTHIGAGTATAGGIGVAALAAGAGALTLGERGHGDTTPDVSSPADDNVPLSQLIGSQKTMEPAAGADPTASPTLSTKTRRAPPPAPVRSATTLSTSSANAPALAPTVLAAEPTSSTGAAAPVAAVGESTSASTNPFGMDDFGTTPGASTGVQHKATNDSGSGSNFDDFDSAFEDLGPSEAVPTSAAAGAPGTTTGGAPAGFDDAFDNDFDFVPSFSAPGAAAGGESASRGAGNNNAFDDFDAAFDSNPSGATKSASTGTSTIAASAIPALGGAAGLGAVAGSASGSADRGTASNTTSGFSFEDAFDPTSTTPSAINTNVPATSTSGAVTSPTAPAGTYAPPPGPPPGFNGPPPPVPARSSTAIAEAEDYTGALPDDAAPVKQLCGMGFTREKVIQALEKSNYRTEKALERLLAST